MTTFTLISDFARDPYWNMAADEWLAGYVESHLDDAIFRLYTWQPGAISFGFSQTYERAMQTDQLGETPVVRRITGGRALYHDPSELTYSVAFNAAGAPAVRLGLSVTETQARIAEVLTAFLNRLGIDSTFSRTEPRLEKSLAVEGTAPCFASSGRYELLSAARKVAASAQRRFACSVLQHGSIKIAGLAPHPALAQPGLDTESKITSKPMSQSNFEEYVEQFAATLRDTFGLTIPVREFDSSAREAIAQHQIFVQQNRLIKRDIFKHSELFDSL